MASKKHPFFSFFPAVLWRVGWLLARKWRRWSIRHQNPPALPLWRVGSCRVGGAGKTPVVQLLVKHAQSQNLRVAILCHALGKIHPDLYEVKAQDNWEDVGDEALWHKHQSQVAVFITRHRRRAWHALEALQRFDLVVCDDGLEDPRLDLAPTWFLDWQEGTQWHHLLPFGNCRSLRSDHPNARQFVVGHDLHFSCSPPQNCLGQKISSSTQIGVLCGIGDPQRFLQNLQSMQLHLAHTMILPDHSQQIGLFAQRFLDNHPEALVMTGKDAIKLPSELRQNPRIYVAEARTLLSCPESFYSWI